ncbi:MAG: hypothetical protein OEY89_18735, partial [Gammaproteobacteria bacterium]|nr:hypothetical protein [Gammaproteobacteria bacterium]
ISFRDLTPKLRIIKKPIAIILLVILVITILLSIRRTIWVITFLGIISVLIFSRRMSVQHYIAGAFASLVLGLIIITAPPLENIRNKLTGYIISMNLFDEKIAKSIDNEVHTDNVQKYTQIITDNPTILMFGYRGYPGPDYLRLPEKYSDKYPLGVAHNGILRSIYYFGIGGLLIFVLFTINASFKYFSIKKYNDNYLMKHVGIASILWLFLTFSASLFYIPPFWTTFKGVFYTFISVYLIRATIFYYKSEIDEPINESEITVNTGSKFDECKLRQ